MSEKTGEIIESVTGIVDRVTYHNPENGWSVLRISPFNNPHVQETVTVHQTKVFAGATMEFHGAWTHHPEFGRQFKATKGVEKKPATTAALEKYLGSGLIKGVGPKTSKRIVDYFGADTLDIFEEKIERLAEVHGIALKKLAMIRSAWSEHRSIREVIMFLQSHGISSLFAVRIYKTYKNDAIKKVSEDPYRLARDFYGIGFFSADKIALSVGFERGSPERITAAIRHVLSASRDMGHCYLTLSQTKKGVKELLEVETDHMVPDLINRMRDSKEIMTRKVVNEQGAHELGCYSKSLFFDELRVAEKIFMMGQSSPAHLETLDMARLEKWVETFCRSRDLVLSHEQDAGLKGMIQEKFSILTGGPGCGKTTLVLVFAKLLEAMGLKVLLAAPTGRAAQRMMDVIGQEAKTLHRLLEWRSGGFVRNEENPLDADFIIVDECSMLDISLTASLLKAVPENSQLLFIGDVDQLPSVGAGNTLKDIIASGAVPCYRLETIFRQARSSLIVQYAHEINQGAIPRIDSPFENPKLWEDGADCLFIDSDEGTQEQLRFISRAKRIDEIRESARRPDPGSDLYAFRVDESVSPYETEMTIPDKFRHVDVEKLVKAGNASQELLSVLKKVHPWSSLHYGLPASQTVKKLYVDWIPKYLGRDQEIQILTPMTRGSLGSINLNRIIQEAANPSRSGKAELKIGERIFREGDRVIHRRNNYDLGVFNGDIGVIGKIDNENLTCVVSFFPDFRKVQYQRENIMELDLAYAITIHKSQGSEFGAVIIPVLTQHFKMLFRNLIYTGITRAKTFVALVGSRRALAMAVRNSDIAKRQTCLQELLEQRAAPFK